MSYTTMNMFAPLTSASDTEMKAALRAGWRWRDVKWERLSEAGNAAYQAGDSKTAIRRFRQAYLLARFGFDHADPRYATSLANAGFADRIAGNTKGADRKLKKARTLWSDVPAGLANITISPRARSSLFHLRMEARHWETYCDNARVRLGKFVAESAQALDAVARREVPEHRLYSRWRGEKPNVFDDTRKYLGAALLLAGEKHQKS